MSKRISEMTKEEREEFREIVKEFFDSLLHEEDCLFFVGISRNQDEDETSSFLTLSSLPSENMVEFIKILLRKYERDAILNKYRSTFIRGEDAKDN